MTTQQLIKEKKKAYEETLKYVKSNKHFAIKLNFNLELDRLEKEEDVIEDVIKLLQEVEDSLQKESKQVVHDYISLDALKTMLNNK